MSLRRVLFSALVLVFALLVVVSGSPAAAQKVDDSNETTLGVPSSCAESIDNQTYLCSSSVDDGTATLKLWSTQVQGVTFTDAGGFVAGGEVYQQDERLLPDRRSTIVMPITETDGFAGVSISTSEVLYAVPLKRQKPGFLPGSPQSEDPAIAALTMFSLFAVAFPVSYVGLKRYSGGVTDEL